MMTPHCFSWLIQVKSNVFIPSLAQVHLLPITWDTIMVGNELGNVLSDDGYATGV